LTLLSHQTILKAGGQDSGPMLVINGSSPPCAPATGFGWCPVPLGQRELLEKAILSPDEKDY